MEEALDLEAPEVLVDVVVEFEEEGVGVGRRAIESFRFRFRFLSSISLFSLSWVSTVSLPLSSLAFLL